MEDLHDDANEQHTVLETTERDEGHQGSQEPAFGLDGTTDHRHSSRSTSARARSLRPRSAVYNGTDAMLTNGYPSSGLNPTSAQAPAVIIPRSRPHTLPYSSARSGLVYDSRMRFHMDQISSNDDAHPEKPSRILEIFSEFVKADIVASPWEPESGSDYHLLRIPAREATEAELCLIHSRDHVDRVKRSTNWSIQEIKANTEIGGEEASVYWHKLTWLCACLSAGGAIEATRAVVLGQVKNAVAVIRPPGHHAEHGEASGFCFFNNVPIAARVVQEEFPDKARKIVILDWDVHHGNGIQHAFEDNPNILYISLHVYSGGSFYPHRMDGDHTHCGIGAGQGRNVNIPWKSQGMTDADYMLAFQQIVMPICIEFDPDLVMISAGFDAAAGDPLGGCFVSPAAYAHMTHMLMQLARGKVVACLEGGYNLRSIAISALTMTKTLMGEPPERLTNIIPTPSAISTIQQVIRTQSVYWKCLYPKDLSIRLRGDGVSERLHDVIRERQAEVMWDNYQMVSLPLRRTKVSKSLKDQVLVTQNHHEARPLLLIFHDPPQATDISERNTNVLELHNTLLTDSVKHYIAWAVEANFAVIDVNIPEHLTAEHDEQRHVEKAMPGSEDERHRMSREVAYYIWDNYIQVGEPTHVFLMGVGEAFYGLVELLKNREDALKMVDLTIGFVAEQTLRGVSDPDNDQVARMYKANSLIFIANNHPTFDPDSKTRPKRRHGQLQKSPFSNLQDMLESHIDEVTKPLLQKTVEWRQNNPSISSAIVPAPPSDPDAMDTDLSNDPATDLP